MSTRVEKFNKEMKKELGTLFQTHANDWFEGAFITVTEVNSSPDLGYIKVYLSIFQNKKSQHILNLIELYSKQLRKELASKIKNSVRVIPEIQFFEDKSLENAQKFENLFEKIRIERESRENNQNN